MSSEKIFLDGCDPDEAIMVRSPRIVLAQKPVMIWLRDLKGSETSSVVFQTLGSDSCVLDRGIISDPSLCVGPSGQILSVWAKAQQGSAFHVWAGDPLAETSRPERISGDRASMPAAAFNGDGQALTVWARIRGRHRVIEGSAGLPWGQSFEIRTGGWASRPAVCGLRDGSFLAVWDELSPEGGSIEGRVIHARGRSTRDVTVFPRQNPSLRYIKASCVSLSDSVLVVAVRTQDVTCDDGIIDQDHEVVAALIDAETGRIDALGSLAQLNHGLLSDPALKTQVWGYLGHRLQPRALAGGRVYWERKETHDSFTEQSRGVLCCRDWDRGRKAWGAEMILHRGGLLYDAAHTEAGDSWVLYRSVIHGRTHQLVAESIPKAGQEVSDKTWLCPQDYRPAEFPVKSSERGERHAITAHGQTFRLYWGDPHVHSSLSVDVEGEPDELLHYARDLARLDFVALTDNDDLYTSWLTLSERLHGSELAEVWTEDGKFAALDGFEYPRPKMQGSPKNHRTVLVRDHSGQLFRWSDPVREDEKGIVAGPDHRNTDGLAAAAERIRAVLIGHHQLWSLSGSETETGLEAVSSWDTYIHDAEYIHRVWNAGRRLCLIGGSDGHRRNAGLGGACTGVWARALDCESILEAIVARRTIATQGRRPLVELELTDEGGKRLFIGDYGKLKGRITARIRAAVEPGYDDRIELVELLHREKKLANWGSCDTTDGGRKLEVDYELFSVDSRARTVALDLIKPNYLYLRIKQSGPDRQFPSNVAPARGPWAWTTPIWWE